MAPTSLSLASLLFALAVILPAVVLAAHWRVRRDVDARLAAARGLADAVAVELGFAAPVPCREPYREGNWSLIGEVASVPVQLLVNAGGTLLYAAFEPAGTPPWDLAHASDFGRGGLADLPYERYRAADPAELGPDWLIKGADAEARLHALPEGVRAYLRAPPPNEHPRVVGGRLVTSAQGTDAAALADWVRGVVGALALAPGDALDA